MSGSDSLASWRASFGLRVFLLVTLVAVSAVGATAWLSVRLVPQQIEASIEAARWDDMELVDALAAYGRGHGTWVGVSNLVYQRYLADGHRQRIRLTTTYDEVVVDTEVLGRRAARPAASTAILIDPRPRLHLRWGTDDAVGPLRRFTLDAIADYRLTARLAACLVEHGEEVAMSEERSPVPKLAIDPGDVGEDCSDRLNTPDAVLADDNEAVSRCAPQPAGEFPACLERTFADRISEFSAVPLKLYLGAIDIPALLTIRGPVFIAGGGVLALALLGTVLVARRIIRPVRALTAASARLADGQLDARVHGGGADELGRLSRSFNRMASSIENAKHSQQRLIADVAHELRTPLSNLRGYIEALRDGVFPPSQDVFASLYEEALLQQRIVDDLQDLALAESGTLVYQRIPADLAELVEVSGRAAQPAAELAGVRLVIETPSPLPVQLDADRIRQVLGNLLSNAIRHTPPGGTVTLRTQAVGGNAMVEVADSGHGISPADLPHVFDRFWRADPARGRATGGSGLGLTISRQFVSDLGGSIEASSEPGIGTTMTITLPLTRVT